MDDANKKKNGSSRAMTPGAVAVVDAPPLMEEPSSTFTSGAGDGAKSNAVQPRATSNNNSNTRRNEKKSRGPRATTPGAVAIVAEDPPLLEPETSSTFTKDVRPTSNGHNSSNLNSNLNNSLADFDLSTSQMDVLPAVVEPSFEDEEDMLGRRPSPRHSPSPTSIRDRKEKRTTPAARPGAVAVSATKQEQGAAGRPPPSPRHSPNPSPGIPQDRKQRRTAAATQPGAVPSSPRAEEPDAIEPTGRDGGRSPPPRPNNVAQDRKQRRAAAATRPGAVASSEPDVEEPDVEEPTRPPPRPNIAQDRKQRRAAAATRPGAVHSSEPDVEEPDVEAPGMDEPTVTTTTGRPPPSPRQSPDPSPTVAQNRKQRRAAAATRPGAVPSSPGGVEEPDIEEPGMEEPTNATMGRPPPRHSPTPSPTVAQNRKQRRAAAATKPGAVPSSAGGVEESGIEEPDMEEPTNATMGRPPPRHSPTPSPTVAQNRKQRGAAAATMPGAVPSSPGGSGVEEPDIEEPGMEKPEMGGPTRSPTPPSTIQDRKQRRANPAVAPGAVAVDDAVEEPGDDPANPAFSRVNSGKNRKKRRGQGASVPGALAVTEEPESFEDESFSSRPNDNSFRVSGDGILAPPGMNRNMTAPLTYTDEESKVGRERFLSVQNASVEGLTASFDAGHTPEGIVSEKQRYATRRVGGRGKNAGASNSNSNLGSGSSHSNDPSQDAPVYHNTPATAPGALQAIQDDIAANKARLSDRLRTQQAQFEAEAAQNSTGEVLSAQQRLGERVRRQQIDPLAPTSETAPIASVTRVESTTSAMSGRTSAAFASGFMNVDSSRQIPGSHEESGFSYRDRSSIKSYEFEEEAANRKPNKWFSGRNRWIVIGLVLLVIIGAVVGGVLGSSGGSSSSGGGAPTPAPTTTSPSRSPTMPPTVSDEAMEEWLAEIARVSPDTSFDDLTAPASLALSWMTSDPYSGDILEEWVFIQRFALVTFWYSTNGENWTVSKSWLNQRGDHCSWEGVVCTSGSVRSLALSESGLAGSLPLELGLVTALQILTLNMNGLTGSIPTHIGDLTSLIQFVLTDNELVGSLPSEMGMLSGMHSLHVDSNKLTGTIPTEITQNLTGLIELWANDNSLSGPIWFGEQSTQLKELRLSDNQFTGTLPAALGGITQLSGLWLGRNSFDAGTIPIELFQLSNLENLKLNNLKLEGPLQLSIGALTNLKELNLLSNQLTGAVPSELGLLVNLEMLSLQRNDLTGSIPPSICEAGVAPVIDCDEIHCAQGCCKSANNDFC